MCNHLTEDYFPCFDESGGIECLDAVLGCTLLDDAEAVLNGRAVYDDANPLTPDYDGWHRTLRWLPVEPSPTTEVYDEEIPF